MNKRGLNERPAEVTVFAGVDVSARELTVAVWRNGGEEAVFTLPNTAAGHASLKVRLVGKRKIGARVCLEASGNYGLDLCLALQRDTRMELSVVNPRSARRFAESLNQRSKTDPVDARVLCEHARRMPCVPWQAPGKAALQLRTITRALAGLTKMATQEKNRQHALDASAALPEVVGQILHRHQQDIEKARGKLAAQALRVIAANPELKRRFALLQSVRGVGQKSALAILGELATLPATMDARQWVAYCGLDPKHVESGSSVHQKPRMSKAGNRRLRHALYMPALVAVCRDPHVRVFYQRLQGRGKAKLQAIVAVMRKLLHAIHAMFRSNQLYTGAKLCPQLPTITSQAA